MLHAITPRRLLILYLGDLAATMLSLPLAYALRVRLPFGQQVTPIGLALTLYVYLLVALIWSVVFFAQAVYSPENTARLVDETRAVVLAIVFSTFTLCGVLYLSLRGLSRLLFFYFFIVDLIAVIAVRLAGRMWFTSMAAGKDLARNVLIVGANELGQELAQALMSLPWAGLRVVGYVDDNLSEPGYKIEGLPVLGCVKDTEQIIAQSNVHEVIFANPGENRRTVANLLAHLEEKSVSVRVVPDLMDLAFLRATASQVGSIPLIGLKQPVLDEYQRLAKRLLDLAVAIPALVLSFPLMLGCAIWIRLDSPGPAIFKQQRVGENGQLFWMYKFRTMFVGAEDEEYKLITHAEDGRLLFLKRADDPRVTRAGRFLRRFSLDELPQLLNVLKAEMSLVGPRPELPALMRLYEPGQRKRLCVPPGLTGWWQINDRSDSTKYSQTEHDLHYLQNYSLRLDLQILWRTIGVVLRGKGAY